MPLSVPDAARLLGMKPSEVVAVDEVDGRTVVTTHDGHQTDVGPVRVIEPEAEVRVIERRGRGRKAGA